MAQHLVEVCLGELDRYIGIAQQVRHVGGVAQAQEAGAGDGDVQPRFQAVVAACRQIGRLARIQRQRVHARGLQPVHQPAQFRIGGRRAAVQAPDLADVLPGQRQRHIGIGQQLRHARRGAVVQGDGAGHPHIQPGFQAVLATGRQLVHLLQTQRQRVHASGLQAVDQRVQRRITLAQHPAQIGVAERDRHIGIGQQARQFRRGVRAQQAGAGHRDVGARKVEPSLAERQHIGGRHADRLAVAVLQPGHAIDMRVSRL